MENKSVVEIEEAVIIKGEHIWGDNGTILYPDCGGDYMNLHMC